MLSRFCSITFSLLFPILLFYFLCAYPLLFLFFYIFLLLSNTQACSPKKVGRQTLDYMKGQEKLPQWIISYKKVRGRRPRLTASLRITQAFFVPPSSSYCCLIPFLFPLSYILLLKLCLLSLPSSYSYYRYLIYHTSFLSSFSYHPGIPFLSLLTFNLFLFSLSLHPS